MLKPRVLLPSLGLFALILGGCIITQAQVFASFNLPSPFTIDSSANQFERITVDLNTISDYKNHKDNLKGLSDVAVVGKFTNVLGPAGNVEVWITADNTNYSSIAQVKANGTLMWTGAIGATGSVNNMTWDESAKAFNAAGKAVLIHEVKGDGAFTIYCFGSAGTYHILVENGAIILTIDAGV